MSKLTIILLFFSLNIFCEEGINKIQVISGGQMMTLYQYKHLTISFQGPSSIVKSKNVTLGNKYQEQERLPEFTKNYLKSPKEILDLKMQMLPHENDKNGNSSGDDSVLSLRSFSDAPSQMQHGDAIITDLTKVKSRSLGATDQINSSPMFSDHEGGIPNRALRGGIIVEFKDEYPEDKIKEIFARFNLTEFHRKEIFRHRSIWKVETDPGLHNLELAKNLGEVSEIASAEPVWWILQVGR